jgi:hypothetical protein
MTYFHAPRPVLDLVRRTAAIAKLLLPWRRAGLLAAAFALACVSILSACFSSQEPAAGSGGGDGLLAGLAPSRQQGIVRAARLTDGTVAIAGDHWNTSLTATFRSSQAFAEWDLGESKPVRAGFLQGDNNDTYLVSVSEDGVTFKTLWEAGPVSGGGMQMRARDDLQGQGRYVRISARDGDGLYALTELQLYASRPAVFPPRLAALDGAPLEENLRTKILLFGLALSVAVLLSYKQARSWWTLALVGLVLVAGWDLWRTLQHGGPAGMQEVSLVRAVVAAVACIAVLREALSPPKLPADRRVVLGALGLTAVLSFAAFYNLGHLQFFDRKSGTPSFVHTFDMRVYYPVAKYWKELGFDGVYLASVAAAVDDDPNTTLDSLGKITLRSLKTHRTHMVSEVKADIEQVRTRFSPSRWEEFKKDMRYFRLTMGTRDYYSTLTDHGANATPVWLAIANLLFRWTNATDATLVLGGLLDPVLLLVMFGFIWRTFGLRTMLISVVVFGANDYYMFGSNWAGATLRHDWMAYLGIGVCLLARKKWEAGGALLMMAALIRAFPALALAGAAMPAAWWALDYRKNHGSFPSWTTWKTEQRPILRVALGAAVCGGILFLLSVAVCGLGSWPDWYRKVVLLDTGAAVNQVSLRGLLGGTDAMYARILRSRMVLQWAGIAAYMALVVAAARKQRLEHAAILGLMGVPVVFNPANYYSHFIFLIPILGAVAAATHFKDLGKPARGMDAGIWIILLLLCAMQYTTVTDKDTGHHFVVAGAFLLVAMTAILLMHVARNFQLGLQPAAMPADEALGAAAPPAEAPPELPPAPEAAQAAEPPAEEPPAAEPKS